MIRAFLLASLLATPACKTHSHQWSFSLTRSVYRDGVFAGGYYPHESGGNADEAGFVLVLLLIPVALDILFLPVALTHDLCD